MSYSDFTLHNIREKARSEWIIAPIIKENINEAIGQTAASMFAAQVFNKRNNSRVLSVYGVITGLSIFKHIVEIAKKSEAP